MSFIGHSILLDIVFFTALGIVVPTSSRGNCSMGVIG